MELMRGGKADEPSEKEVERMMKLANEVIKFVYERQEYPSPMWRVRAVAAVFGRIMGATANNRLALARDIDAQLELAREGAFHYMKHRENGLAVPPPAP